MPHKRPNGPEFLACHRMLMDRPVAATASREAPSKWAYGVEANGEAAFWDRFGDHFEIPGHPATEHGLPVLRESVREHGALTAALHSTSENLPTAAESAALDAGVHLSENLTGGVFVNQSAAFSDFPASAANPAAGTTLSDPAFVTGRFATLQLRRPVPAEESGALGAHRRLHPRRDGPLLRAQRRQGVPPSDVLRHPRRRPAHLRSRA